MLCRGVFVVCGRGSGRGCRGRRGTDIKSAIVEKGKGVESTYMPCPRHILEIRKDENSCDHSGVHAWSCERVDEYLVQVYSRCCACDCYGSAERDGLERKSTC